MLLTRFTLRIFGCHWLDPAWLVHRRRFFERICVPSAMARTGREFRWLLFCDTTTTDCRGGS